jgi:hypothetical protein
MRRACVAAIALAMGGACDDVKQHIYTAHAYNATNDCFAPSTALDVISGDTTGDNCAPECLVDSNGNVFVSTVCAPYPQGFTTEAQVDASTDPCAPALAAWSRGSFCGPDGSAPDAAPDATTDGAGDDAAGDDGAGGDATGDDASGDGAKGDAASDAGAG